MARSLLVDTWGWLAFGRPRDPHHTRVKSLYERLQRDGSRFFTTDYILDELVTLLFRRESFAEAVGSMDGIFTAAAQGRQVIHRIAAERFAAAWNLRRQLQDKPLISFTDLTSLALMKELNLTEILTEDEHFTHVGMGMQLVS